MSRTQGFARLTAFALAVALITSRIGLIVHEVVGHGAPAIACGAHITELHLYWFAGGWINYARAAPWTLPEALIVQLGGVAIESLGALALWLAARRATVGRPLARLALLGAATGLAIHAGFYLAAGTFHGFGDGLLLHRELGAARIAIWAPVGAACVAIAFVAARALITGLRGYAPVEGARAQVPMVLAALAVAAAAHGALTGVELWQRANPTYTAMMQTESQRAVEREVAAATRPHATEDELAAIRADAAARHRTFPFKLALLLAIAAAAVAGAARSRPALACQALPDRALVVTGLCALGSVGLVVAISLLA